MINLRLSYHFIIYLHQIHNKIHLLLLSYNLLVSIQIEYFLFEIKLLENFKPFPKSNSNQAFLFHYIFQIYRFLNNCFYLFDKNHLYFKSIDYRYLLENMIPLFHNLKSQVNSKQHQYYLFIYY